MEQEVKAASPSGRATAAAQSNPQAVSSKAGIPDAGLSDRWDGHFLKLALVNARMSKDPSTQVGAVIVGPDREIRSTGFNGLPRGISDTAERLCDRETKLKLIVHAEMNAILNAARIGTALRGCTLYLSATDETGAVWGGPPCTRCTVETIQSGITRIVSLPFKSGPSKWTDDIETARGLLVEAGLDYQEFPAKAIDARSGETERLDPKGDSAVPERHSP